MGLFTLQIEVAVSHSEQGTFLNPAIFYKRIKNKQLRIQSNNIYLFSNTIVFTVLSGKTMLKTRPESPFPPFSPNMR